MYGSASNGTGPTTSPVLTRLVELPGPVPSPSDTESGGGCPVPVPHEAPGPSPGKSCPVCIANSAQESGDIDHRPRKTGEEWDIFASMDWISFFEGFRGWGVALRCAALHSRQARGWPLPRFNRADLSQPRIVRCSECTYCACTLFSSCRCRIFSFLCSARETPGVCVGTYSRGSLLLLRDVLRRAIVC